MRIEINGESREVQSGITISALLEGRSPLSQPYTVERAPAAIGLPRTFALRAHDRTLRLDRRRVEPLRVSTIELGTGFVPEGIEVHPLEQLDDVELPAENEP